MKTDAEKRNQPKRLWRCIYIGPDGTNGHCHGTIKQCIKQVDRVGAHSVSLVLGDLRKVVA